VAGQRKQLSRLVQVAGDTMRTTARHRIQLRRTIQDAPGTLVQARAFLADLEATTRPLGPAAQALRATAPALTTTLAQLPAFQRAAEPTLSQASATAPSLTRLARRATPVLRQAVPTLKTTADVLETAVPVTKTLRVSTDDLLGMLEGWGRAIQTRDRLGHVFRGRAAVGLETFRSAIARLTDALAPKVVTRRDLRPESHAAPDGNVQAPGNQLPDPKSVVNGLTKRLPSEVKGAVQNLVQGGSHDASKPTTGIDRLLDYLFKP
jgi:hypothetical protein